MKVIRSIIICIYIVLLIGGAITNPSQSSWEYLRRYGEMMFLWVAALCIAADSKPTLKAFALAACIGWLSEVLGVATGLVFGPYSYTNVLGWKLLEVPVVMIAAWYVLLSYAWFHVHRIHSPFAKMFIAALIMTVLDLIIDPVAIGPMKLWQWYEQGVYYGVPLRNFIGWYMVSLLATIPICNISAVSSASHVVGFSVVLFFTVVALKSKLWVAAMFGGIILATDIAIACALWQRYIRSVRYCVYEVYDKFAQ